GRRIAEAGPSATGDRPTVWLSPGPRIARAGRAVDRTAVSLLPDQRMGPQLALPQGTQRAHHVVGQSPGPGRGVLPHLRLGLLWIAVGVPAALVDGDAKRGHGRVRGGRAHLGIAPQVANDA